MRGTDHAEQSLEEMFSNFCERSELWIESRLNATCVCYAEILLRHLYHFTHVTRFIVMSDFNLGAVHWYNSQDLNPEAHGMIVWLLECEIHTGHRFSSLNQMVGWCRIRPSR